MSLGAMEAWEALLRRGYTGDCRVREGLRVSAEGQRGWWWFPQSSGEDLKTGRAGKFRQLLHKRLRSTGDTTGRRL